MKKLAVLVCIFSFINFSYVLGQEETIDYSKPTDYEIGGISVEGNKNTDGNAIIALSGLSTGKKIKVPGPDIPRALKALWKLKLFVDVQVYIEKKIGDVLFLTIMVKERPTLSRYSYIGTKKSYHDDLNDEINRFLLKGTIVTQSTKQNSVNAIKGFFAEKGYLDAVVKVEELNDTLFNNRIRLIFNIDRGERIKIEDIRFAGNESIEDKKLRKLMKNTRRKKRIFASSKMIKHEYEEDKKAIIAHYNKLGYRDIVIEADSLSRDPESGDLYVDIILNEGPQYYHRNIKFKGNSIYKDETLNNILGIEKGDIYNNELLETRLRYSDDQRDVSTLYMDNGYLFFQVNPTEVSIVEDSIDLEVRIFEGPQAEIDAVRIDGNTRTNEHVVRRELRTRPGKKFSRSDIIRSQREIINLGYFNPEALGINTPVNQQQGTVDIEYTVEEKPSDQLELSAGWGGAGRGVIGTLGVTFNNFSIKNIFKRETWNPLPQGDGQRLSLRGQTNGQFYQAYNFSFTEPWLGGKKPNAFTLAAYYTRFYRGDVVVDGVIEPSTLTIAGGSVGLGTRLKFPDDFFVSNTTLSLQNIKVQNYTGFYLENGEPITGGSYNNFSLNQTIARNSIDNPIFPKQGSNISLAMQFTPPYSLFKDKDTDYENMDTEEKFKFLEYHKWRLNAEWYTPIYKDLTFKASAKIGMLGYYNDKIGVPPFERFELGGDGISNFQGIQGKDIISLRGYEVEDLAANVATNNGGTSVFNKFAVEVRYPLSLNPMSTIYVLAFLEGGNSWNSFREYNPFDLKRSAGMGLRVYLPMFGILGFDYGFGFDKNLGDDARWTEYGSFNIILGFEPE